MRGDRRRQQRSNTQKASRCGANQHQESQLGSTFQRIDDGHECLPLSALHQYGNDVATECMLLERPPLIP